MRRIFLVAFAAILGVAFLSTPTLAQRSDSTMVFVNPETPLVTADTIPHTHIYGLDILFSNNGFGMGFFYRKEYSRTIQGFATLAISEAKDDNEVEQYDYNTGQTYVPGKINRFLVFPMTIGVQYRLFSDDIMDNFRPYVMGGVGPAVVLSSPYSKEFFSSLGSSQAHWTFNGFIGAGAYFGNESGNIMGLSFRYYFLPVTHGIPSLQDLSSNIVGTKSQFGGFFISLNFGSSY